MQRDTDSNYHPALPMLRDTEADQSDVLRVSEAELSDLEEFPQAEIDAQVDDSEDAERPWMEVATGRRGGGWRTPPSCTRTAFKSSAITTLATTPSTSTSPSRAAQCGAAVADARVAQYSAADADARAAQCLAAAADKRLLRGSSSSATSARPPPVNGKGKTTDMRVCRELSCNALQKGTSYYNCCKFHSKFFAKTLKSSETDSEPESDFD